MSQPYSVSSDVLNNTLSSLTTDAGWITADINARILEGDTTIDGRLAGLGYTLPWSTNPPLVGQLSILYARYACFRDMFAGNTASKGVVEAAHVYKDRFEEMLQQIEDGWLVLVDSTGTPITPSKFDVLTTQNTAAVDDEAGKLISSYVDDYDADDGVGPATAGD